MIRLFHHPLSPIGFDFDMPIAVYLYGSRSISRSISLQKANLRALLLEHDSTVSGRFHHCSQDKEALTLWIIITPRHM